MKIFSDIILDFAYAVAGKIQVDEFTIRNFSQYYTSDNNVKVNTFCPNKEDWKQTCVNLAVLKEHSLLQHQIFVQLYNID